MPSMTPAQLLDELRGVDNLLIVQDLDQVRFASSLAF